MSHDHRLKITCMKTATYSVMHFTVAIAVAFALTGSWKMALAIGLIEPFVQTFAFALHERLWARSVSKDERRTTDAAGEVAAAVSGTRLGKTGYA